MDGLFGTGIKFHRGASNLRRGFREIYDHFLHPAEQRRERMGRGGGWYLLCLRQGLIPEVLIGSVIAPLIIDIS